MWDVVVVGGGPAGLASGLYARRAGLSVAIVEARRAPIDKACGEGLMPPAVRALEDLGIRPHGRSFRGICYRSGPHSAVADFANGTGLAVRRTGLHADLHAAAVGAGVELIQQHVRDVRTDHAQAWVDGIAARYVIAADGLHSHTRRSLGLDRPTPAARWGVRAHFACAPWTDRVEVHWSAAGEAYVTPVAPDCVGVAVLGGDRRPFAERLRDFPSLVDHLPARPAASVRGAGPLHQRARARVAGRVLLVGDSAGYVDALTGEGLSMAFACARAAVGRIVEGRPDRYEHDYRGITRRYRLITKALLSVAGQPLLRRGVVPLAERAPWLFAAAVNQLAR
jgi:flavin-dependent dehydrogenase